MLFATTLNAQNSYDTLWQDVQEFENKNLPKSALKIVENIYAKANATENPPQIIKALFYKSKFSLILEEDAQLKIISQFKEHIDKSSFPTRNVLENVLANLYWQYFSQNKWKFYNRTKTDKKVDKTDFRTWDLDTLFAEIHIHYQKSLENSLLLQKTDIYDFSDILSIVQNSKEYRPSLFDFLAHNALDFYKTSETTITKPNYQFKIDNSKLIGDATTFLNINLTTKDKNSLQFNALKIYQELINFHLKNNHLKALITIDLERLNFVNNHAVFNDKQKLFLQTLKKSEEKQQRNATSKLYSYQIARIYRKQAKSYQFNKKEVFRFKNKEALAICNAVISKFPNSIASKKCNALKKQITTKSLAILAEKFSPVNTPSRLLITYNNIDNLHFTAYKIDENKITVLNNIYKEKERINFIKKLTKIKSWHNKLRNEFDYRKHTTEVIVPKLSQGNYLIVAHQSNVLNINQLYAIANIQVSNLALIQNTNTNKTTYQVVNRNTGKPIENATLLLQNNQPNSRKKLYQKLTTDKNGFATYINDYSYYIVSITVSSKNDSATFGDYYFYKHQENITKNNTENSIIKPFIFTDRSIYRPGQTVYFKTILIQNKKQINTSFSNSFIEVTLNDANGQKIKTLDLKLNEFGSASGQIVLPNIGLTGRYNFSIRKSAKEKKTTINGIPFYFERKNNINYILVEQYKRTKFETDFNSVTQTFKVNDIIRINGFARAFSGANITNAKVVYRVYRKVQYPNWWHWRRHNYSAESQEITNGKTITDMSGNFSIEFKAIPDESVSKESLPIFNYEITTDITDVNGETRSITTLVKVGYHTLLTSLEINSILNKDEKQHEINITTNNLNGQFVPTKGVLKIYKLQAPKNPLRKRPWNTPDYQDISENKFRKLFPNDAYFENELNQKTWEKGNLVFEESFNTKKSRKIILKKLKNWSSGAYIAVLNTKDKFNQKITDKAYFNITSTYEEKVADNELFFIKTDKKSYNINENVNIQIGSASKNMTVIVEIEKDYKTIKTHFIHLSNEIKNIKIPINKNDIDGFAVKYYFVNYNSFNTGLLNISVKNQQENISIETNTFRNKLQPNNTEKWSFAIKNDKKNKVTAEVLASMYDASLDEFETHNWQFNPIIKTTYYSAGNSSNAYHSFGKEYFRVFNKQYSNKYYQNQQYDRLNWFGFRFTDDVAVLDKVIITARGLKREEKPLEDTAKNISGRASRINIKSEEETHQYSAKKESSNSEKTDLKGIKVRKNLQETAFFYPHLITDKKGNITFSFTTPQALTKWKLQLLAHTKEALSATKTLTTVTQKELMITPNVPRFLREGDTITLSAKISNLSEERLTGISQLILTNAITGKEINLLNSSTKNQNFSVNSKENTAVSWNLIIPNTIQQAIQYKIIAKAGNFSDGEQNILPVLSNKILVTETLPMWIGSNQTKTFTLNKLKNNTSKSLKHHKLTLEITSNPAWYAVQALPYLMEHSNECSEQIFARYYANTLANHILNSNSKIQEVFKQWKSSDVLLSNLEKNKELKSLIIQQTPWLDDAQSETEQKKRIALLFDLNTIKNKQENTINKLENMQMSNGGFPWFKGSNYANIYITQHIVSGFGHLKKLGISSFDNKITKILKKAITFLDTEIAIQYSKLLKKTAKIKAEKGQTASEDYLKKNHLNYATIQYLYMRSFYPEKNISSETKTAILYYQNQTTTYWKTYNLYAQAQISLIQFRDKNKTLASKILKSLKENSITSDELGMYWKNNIAGYYNYQAPIETQVLLMEAFSEVEDDIKTVDNLKIWLLKNKQTNRWKTTKATTRAIYALLLKGSNWISISNMIDIKIGNKKIESSKLENAKIEAGAGYFKTSWNNNKIRPNMSEVTISKKEKGIAWGSLYWQYFEDLEKITSAKTPLKIRKNLFKKITSDTGKELIKLTDKTQLKVGDLITVRIELRCDRNMEFIHMKDMRASGIEPINVLSKYKWQDGLGYYQTTKDASTDFFFEHLPKGIFVFEYDMRVNNAGNFSNGITTIQSMYAPEFNSHSTAKRLVINEH